MTTKTLINIDALRTEWNKARTAYYAEQSEVNELRMDDALRALLMEVNSLGTGEMLGR